MNKSRHYHFYDAGAFDGETEHRVMCSFFSYDADGHYRPGQSELVLSSEWPAFRKHIEASGWTPHNHQWGR